MLADVVKWGLVMASAAMAVVMGVAVISVMFGPPEEPIHWNDEEED